MPTYKEAGLTDEQLKELHAALELLGAHWESELRIFSLKPARALVMTDNQYYGIYDFNRKSFVD